MAELKFCNICGKLITEENWINRKAKDIWISNNKEITVYHCSARCAEKHVVACRLSGEWEGGINPLFSKRLSELREGKNNE